MSKQTLKNDLYDNPMVRSALKSMSQEQIEEYKRVGQYIYGKTDFVQSKILDQLPPPVDSSAEYIEAGIRSGLLLSDLTKIELEVMKKKYGNEWYKRYGFTIEDFPKE